MYAALTFDFAMFLLELQNASRDDLVTRVLEHQLCGTVSVDGTTAEESDEVFKSHVAVHNVVFLFKDADVVYLEYTQK